jgi:heme-degrading monooxygenase HmoA
MNNYYSKHVGDIYWNKFKKKVHLVGSYYGNFSVHFLQPKNQTFTLSYQPLWLRDSVL